MTSLLDQAFALNSDGTAVDVEAFVQALKQDPEKLAIVESDPDLQHAMLSDRAALQELLKAVYKEEQQRLERRKQRMSERSIDAQRASAPVPRDTVQLYAQLREAGLQYGPAFRLLRNVHVPDSA